MKYKLMRKAVLFVFVILLIIFLIVLFMPGSRYHIMNNLSGTIDIQINGARETPYNLVCYIGDGQEEKIRVKEKNGTIKVSCNASRYDGYRFEYDIDTEDGAKHFSFMIMKTHSFGPAVHYKYDLKLKKEGSEWIANVLLTYENQEGNREQIYLKENENAFIQLGP